MNAPAHFMMLMMRRAWVLAIVLAPAGVAAETITFEEEREPHPGIRILERHTEDPAWRIHAAFVDLCADGVRVEARSPQASRLSVPAWGDAMGVQLAVNGDFYRTDRSTPTVYGDAVGVGVRWPPEQSGLGSEFEGEWYYRNYGWIAFGPDLAEFTHSGWVKENAERFELADGFSPGDLTTDIPTDATALVSGFSELVVEGEVLDAFPDRGDLSDRHPRTAMGLTEDRQTFILAVVDGRNPGVSVGMDGAELAALMGELGAYVAFNLDGGGSSQMWLDGEGLLNDPSDGSPRPVANHWGVFASGEGEPESCVQLDGGGGSPDAGAGDLPDAGPIFGPDAGAPAYPDAAGGAAAPADAGGCRAAPGASAPPVALALVVLAWGHRRRRAER